MQYFQVTLGRITENDIVLLFISKSGAYFLFGVIA